MDDYRYTLTRNLSERYGWFTKGRGDLLVIMLNPSTADDETDDPTIRRVTRFAKREGFDSITVVNLFAKRCTRPIHLMDEGCDPVGPANGMTLYHAINRAEHALCAWGAWADDPSRSAHLHGLRPNVEQMMHAAETEAWCLGVTASGSPRHPLYVRATQPFERWPL